MATIGSGSPLLYVEASAAQTSGSGNKRTIKVIAKFKVNGGSDSWYGFACSWRPSIIVGSTYTYGSWKAIKGTESWNGSNALRTFEQTITVDVGTTAAKAVTIKIETDSSGSSGWDGSYSFSYTTGGTNTPPTFSSTDYVTFKENNSSGAIITNAKEGTENAKKIAENVSAIHMYWPAATDPGDTLVYEIWNQQNESSWSKVGESTDSFTSDNKTYYRYTHQIGTGNEGRSYDYYVKARDSKGVYSGNCDGTQFQKNTLTPYSLTSSSSISSTSSSISFSFSGASNTNGNTSFTKTLSCDGLTVYNGSLATSPATVTIYKSGTVPTGCYIKMSDIQAKFASSNYVGSLTFKLSTKNAYGTTKVSNKVISVNIQSAPVSASATISTDPTLSTVYKEVATGSSSAKARYYIPDGIGNIRVSWSAATSSNGGAVVYDVFYLTGSSTSWTKLASDQTATYYSHKLNRISGTTTLRYLIRSKSKSNPSSYSDKSSNTITLYSYLKPTVSVGAVTRASTSVSVPITLSTNTSISSTVVYGTATLYSGSTKVGSEVSLTAGSKTATISGLTDSGTYSLKIVYADKTGLCPAITYTVPVGALVSAVDICKYGIGTNGLAATSMYGGNFGKGIKVKGASMGSNLLTFDTERPWSFKQGGEDAFASLDLVSSTDDKYFRITNSSGSQKVSFYISNNSAPSIYINDSKVYHTGYKPTASDIGAVSAIASTTGYYGIQGPSGSAGWLRTPSTGLLPYSNGSGALGTSSWRFSSVWSNTLNGFVIGPSSTYKSFNPVVGSDGVMEVGQMLDWHYPDSIKDYDYRMQLADGGTAMAFSEYIKVDGRTFKGWCFTSNGSNYVGIDANDDYLRTYDSSGTVTNNTMSLGSTNYRWNRLYSVEQVSVSSDIKYKENIRPVDDKVEQLFSKLKPCSWNRIDGDTKRRHYGFIAQEVEEAMNECDIPYKDFAFLLKGPVDENGEEIRPSTIENYDTDERIKGYEYSLGYSELISVNTHMIQKLQKENQELRAELNEIKMRLSELEGK